MPSSALEQWETTRREALDEIKAAHKAVGGTARGRRFATLQVTHAYAMLLSSQFQGFCRDLHTESVDVIVSRIAHASLGNVVSVALTQGRKLDQGNPNPGNLGSDFSRLGLKFWPAVDALDARNPRRRDVLERINTWRNAIAHQDWTKVPGQSRRLHLKSVQGWRSACSALATSFDRAVGAHLGSLAGAPPG